MDHIFRPADRQKPLWVARKNRDTVDRMRFYPAVAGLFRQQVGIEIDFTPLTTGCRSYPCLLDEDSDAFIKRTIFNSNQ